MSAKERARRNNRSLQGNQVSLPEVHAAEVQRQQIAVHKASTAPQLLTSPDALHLQHTIGNRGASRFLARASTLQQRSVTLQRWPDIASESGTFTYTLGRQFRDKHVAANKNEAIRKARRWYDPMHSDPHRAAVTVLIASSLYNVTDAEEVTPSGGYDWALMIDVEAVMMGPSGRVGANGDPGQLDENITTVIVSGYNTGNNQGVITHVSVSQ